MRSNGLRAAAFAALSTCVAACSPAMDPTVLPSEGGTTPTAGNGSSGAGGAMQTGYAGSPGAVGGGSQAQGGSASAGANTAGTAGATGGGAAGAANGGGAGDGANGGSSNPTSFCASRTGLAFCEDFESLAAVAPPWKVETIGDGGAVTVSDQQAHSGQRALRVQTGGFSAFLVYQDAKVLPTATGKLYVRAFMRLSTAMTSGHNTFIIADRAQSPGAGNALRLGEMNQMLMYTVAGDTHGALANENFYVDQQVGAALKAAAWGCVEVLIDSKAPELRVWLDGIEVADLHHTDFPVDPYDTLRFGFEKYAGPESEVFYDDVAVGSEPIGCN